MKRLLPLLFLFPSFALILHARRTHDVAVYPVQFVVTSGSYELPEGYTFEVWRDEPSGFAAVVDGRATLEFEREGLAEVRLQIVRAAARGTQRISSTVGQPVAITVARGGEPQLEELVVTREQCESVIARLKAER